MKFARIPSMWAGDEESLSAYMSAIREMAENPELRPQAFMDDDDDEGDSSSHLLTKAGDVGVVTISGALTNETGFMAWWSGATPYSYISNALIEAAQDPQYKSIALRIDSGGGTVAGVEEVSDLIRRIDMNYKPVVAHTSGRMGSAAYWLGCSARQVYATSTAEVGSIGVMAVHTERSKMLENYGMAVTVFSSGKYKTLGNAYEPLSDLARETIQGQMDALGAMFNQHVADNRGVSAATVHDRMGQGRVFFGSEAVTIGLTDGVISFEGLLEKMQSDVDNSENRHKYSRNLITGAVMNIKTLAATPANTVEETVETVEVEAETQTVAEAPATESNAALSMLADQLVESRTELARAKEAMEASAGIVQTLKAEIEAMRPVVTNSVSRMQIALGMSGEVAEMNLTSLISHHENLRTQYETKFRVGGVAAVTPVDAEDANSAVASAEEARRAARIKAARLK